MPRPNKGPRLEANSFGVYEIHWSDNGRSKRSSTRTSDFRSAQKVLANFILLKESDAIRSTERLVMVRDILGDPDVPGADYWHEHIQSDKVSDKATPRYTYAKLIPHFGHLAVRDIDPIHVDDYIAKRKAGRIGRPSVGHTIARELSVLNAAINYAVRKRRLARADAPTIELPAHSPPRDRWLTEAEADALLKAARGDGPKLPRVYRFIALALNTASRKEALLSLKVNQVDIEHGMIRLNPAGRVQTNKRRPPVPISDELRPILELTLEQVGKGEYVLDHPGAIRTAFDSACRRAGLEGVTPHTLRHTWATWAARAGVSMFDIAGVLGDSVQTVIKTYAHHSPEHLRSAINFRRAA